MGNGIKTITVKQNPTQNYMMKNRRNEIPKSENDFRYPDWYYQTGHWCIISCGTDGTERKPEPVRR